MIRFDGINDRCQGKERPFPFHGGESSRVSHFPAQNVGHKTTRLHSSHNFEINILVTYAPA